MGTAPRGRPHGWCRAANCRRRRQGRRTGGCHARPGRCEFPRAAGGGFLVRAESGSAGLSRAAGRRCRSQRARVAARRRSAREVPRRVRRAPHPGEPCPAASGGRRPLASSRPRAGVAGKPGPGPGRGATWPLSCQPDVAGARVRCTRGDHCPGERGAAHACERCRRQRAHRGGRRVVGGRTPRGRRGLHRPSWREATTSC